MKKLSNTEAELKKDIPYKKKYELESLLNRNLQNIARLKNI